MAHLMIDAADDETFDVLCDDKLRLIQKKDGYRFSIDAILLANFVVLKRGDRLLDIGSGCGVIPVYMSKKGRQNNMLGVEIQKDLFDVAQKNALINNCNNIQFINGDITLMEKELKKTPFQVVVSNPPYTKKSTGRKSPQSSRLIARHESQLDLSALISISSSLLFKKGRFYTIYPSKRLGELIHAAKSCKLEPKRLRFIHPRKDEGANLFLAEFIKEGGMEVIVEKPVYIYDNDRYTEELQTYYTLKG
jgi:tRNA1Val (adenine37-N6)-methyltransferase